MLTSLLGAETVVGPSILTSYRDPSSCLRVFLIFLPDRGWPLSALPMALQQPPVLSVSHNGGIGRDTSRSPLATPASSAGGFRSRDQGNKGPGVFFPLTIRLDLQGVTKPP